MVFCININWSEYKKEYLGILVCGELGTAEIAEDTTGIIIYNSSIRAYTEDHCHLGNLETLEAPSSMILLNEKPIDE